MDGIRIRRNNLIGFLRLCPRRAPVWILQIKKRHSRRDADHLTLLRLSAPCDPGLTRCSAACVGWFLPVARSSWREEERERGELLRLPLKRPPLCLRLHCLCMKHVAA